MVSRLDLSKIPPPDVIEELNFDRNLARIVEKLKGTFEGWKAAPSDPYYKTGEIVSSELFFLQARINEAARQCMIAFAKGTNLDNLGALFGLLRATVSLLPDGTRIMEDDDTYRAAIITAFDQYSTSGTRNGYLYWLRRSATDIDKELILKAQSLREEGKTSEAEALEKLLLSTIDFNVYAAASSEDPAIDATTTRDGRITAVAYFLNQAGLDNGELSRRLSLIKERMERDGRIPLNDILSVDAAEVIVKKLIAVLYVPNGPDPKIFQSVAEAGARKFLAENTRIGKRISVSGIFSKLHVDGLIRVELFEESRSPETLVTTDFIAKRNQVFNIEIEIRTDDSEKFAAA